VGHFITFVLLVQGSESKGLSSFTYVHIHTGKKKKSCLQQNDEADIFSPENVTMKIIL
ncbi:unnamed protein product, partial [Pleuronectes platessa]